MLDGCRNGWIPAHSRPLNRADAAPPTPNSSVESCARTPSSAASLTVPGRPKPIVEALAPTSLAVGDGAPVTVNLAAGATGAARSEVLGSPVVVGQGRLVTVTETEIDAAGPRSDPSRTVTVTYSSS